MGKFNIYVTLYGRDPGSNGCDWSAKFRKEIATSFLPPVGTRVDLGMFYGQIKHFRLPKCGVSSIWLNAQTGDYEVLLDYEDVRERVFHIELKVFVSEMSVLGFDRVTV